MSKWIYIFILIVTFLNSFAIGFSVATRVLNKPQQICVYVTKEGETIVPDKITKSDCTFFLGEK